ncbi:MAG: hypothetical protein O3A46_00095 [Candidatus Poribacteria bacterium]|nr:hypothetical protein [Candidatus Poribacteria bacterium]
MEFQRIVLIPFDQPEAEHRRRVREAYYVLMRATARHMGKTNAAASSEGGAPSPRHDDLDDGAGR